MEPELPLITVITLTYNKFNYIYEAIDSVLQQDYPAIEFIISDDCSAQFPKKNIERYIEERKSTNIKRVILLHHDFNLGTVKNYNVALSYASGKYLIGVSGDDKFYDKTIISQIVNRFETTGAEVIVCSRQYMTEKGKDLYVSPTKSELLHIKRMKTNWDQYKAMVIGPFYRFASGSAMYFKRDMLVKRCGFDETYKLWEDGPFIAQYCYEKMILYAYDIISVRYRLGGISTCNIKHPLMLEDEKYFKCVECKKHIKEFDWYNQERIKYSEAMSVHNTMFLKIFYKLRYIHVWLGNRWRQLNEILWQIFLNVRTDLCK